MKTFYILVVFCAIHYSQATEDAAQPKNLDPVAADSTGLLDSTNKAKRLSPPPILPNICQCPMIHAPSCGVDGVIYPNPCARECEGVEGAPITTCITPYRRSGRPCGCTKEYIPVCGGDGKIYGNYCLLRCAGVWPMGDYFCKETGPVAYRRLWRTGRNCRCPKIYDPVYGTRCNEYANLCLLECAGDFLAPDGQC